MTAIQSLVRMNHTDFFPFLKRYRLLLLITVILSGITAGCGSSRESSDASIDARDTSTATTPSTPFSAFSKVVSGSYTTDTGLFTVHFSDGKIYYEIPDSLLGRDMLLIVRIVGVPEDYSAFTASGSSVSEMLVRMERSRKRIQIRSVATTNVAGDSLPIARSVRLNNVEPIIASFDIRAHGRAPDSYLIDVTSFLLEDHPSTTPLSSASRKRFEVRRLESDRSMIDTVRSFPINVEARYQLTYSAAEPPSGSRTGALTFLMSQSFILLPVEPMMARYADPRVGWFTVDKIDFGTDEQRAAARSYIQRWRLEPSDPEAYARGELVEPVKPIVYYLDPATPEKWRPWVRKGIEEWRSAFEAAGFKNAIIAMDPPSEEEDPDFSLEDARYSSVRWIANTTRNAVGPSVADPRTGEIIESDVLFFHNHLKSYRNLYIIETGAVDPRARSLQIPDSILGEMLRAVIAHEVGHALGLPHNMASSAAYPVDSLRSPTFTQRMGIAASIMDYARLNYVAQPGDGEVRLIRFLGPYDRYAINWGYRYLPDARTPEDELATLDRWVREKGDDPIYRFGSQGTEFDPRSQTEDVGDDAMRASAYGVANLKRVLPNLIDWTRSVHNDYDDLRELYGESLNHWYELMSHVATNVGGVYETTRRPNQEGALYRPVPAETQRRALDFLEKEVFTTPTWLVDTTLLRRIEHAGAVDRLRRNQVAILTTLLNEERMARLIEAEAAEPGDAFGLNDLLTSLRAIVWRELEDGDDIDIYRRNLQRGYLAKIETLMTTEPEEPQTTRVSLPISDIRPALRGELVALQRAIRSALAQRPDKPTMLHLEDALARIERILDPND